MKHNSPQGPQPTGVAGLEQFPVLWARLSGEQILGLELPGEWVLGLDLSLGGPLTPPPLSSSSSSSPIAVNISMKWKRKKKDKKERKKISSLEATRSLRPGQPGVCPEQSCAAGPWQPGLLHVRVHPPAGVGGPPEQLFTIQRQQNLEATSKQRTWFCRPPQSSQFRASPWHQSALLGRVPHCLPQGSARLPCPSPWPGEAPSRPKMLLPRWLRCPFEFLLLVYCFWD